MLEPSVRSVNKDSRRNMNKSININSGDTINQSITIEDGLRPNSEDRENMNDSIISSGGNTAAHNMSRYSITAYTQRNTTMSKVGKSLTSTI